MELSFSGCERSTSCGRKRPQQGRLERRPEPEPEPGLTAQFLRI